MKPWTSSWQVLIGVITALALILIPFHEIQLHASAEANADFTVLVYSHGDNDLDGSLVGPGDLKEMVRRADDVNFIVYHDRAEGADPADAPHLNLPLGYSGGYVFRVGSDGKAHDVKSLGEPYTMDPQTLSWFVYYGLTKYPAKTTILVLDDHGGGPNAYFGSEELDSDPSDPRSNLGPMPLNDAVAAIRAGLDAARGAGWRGGENGHRLDAIINATCVNGNYEVYRALRPISRYAYGSEEVTVGTASSGFWDVDYSALPPDRSVSDLSLTYLRSLVASAPETYKSKSSQLGQRQFESFSHAIFDLDQIETVTSALTNFVRQVRQVNGYRYLLEARNAAMGFGRNNGEPDPGLDLYDLGDLLARIPSSAPRDMLLARDSVLNAIVGARRHIATNGHYTGASGLTIYFPPRRSGVNLYYQRIPDPTGWLRLVRDLRIGEKVELGNVVLKLEKSATAWKSSLSTQRKIPRAASGSFVLGADGGSQGVRVLQAVPAIIGAGGSTSAQGVGTFHTFAFGTSSVSPRFARDLSTIEFEAMLIRADTGKQSEIIVSHTASFKGNEWTFGPPQFIQVVNGARATIRTTPGDAVAPLVNYARVVSSATDPTTGEPVSTPPTLSLPRIPQPRVGAASLLSASPIPAGTPLIALANIYTDDYEVIGDIIIEQIDIVR